MPRGGANERVQKHESTRVLRCRCSTRAGEKGHEDSTKLHSLFNPNERMLLRCFLPKRGAVCFFNHATLADEKIGPSRGDGGRERQMANYREKPNYILELFILTHPGADSS